MNEKHDIKYFGNPDSDLTIIQPVDDHDLEEMTDEVNKLTELSGGSNWCIITFRVNDWNKELTPWKADPVFGKEGFGDGAERTLAYVTEELIPGHEKRHPCAGRKYVLGGYSLAGFFALWAAYQTDIFAGTAAVSPSVWYPGWIEYAETHQIREDAVYLSLGDREEKARNKVMARVGGAIREQYKLLADSGIRVTLEWNKGNHFVDNGIRMAKGLAWTLKNIR